MSPKTSIPVTAKLCLLKYTVQFINLLFKEWLSIFEPQMHVTSHEMVGKIFGKLIFLTESLEPQVGVFSNGRGWSTTPWGGKKKQFLYASLTKSRKLLSTSVNCIFTNIKNTSLKPFNHDIRTSEKPFFPLTIYNLELLKFHNLCF